MLKDLMDSLNFPKSWRMTPRLLCPSAYSGFNSVTFFKDVNAWSILPKRLLAAPSRFQIIKASGCSLIIFLALWIKSESLPSLYNLINSAVFFGN